MSEMELQFISHNFNPLRREGGDFAKKEGWPARKQISIHSAARAETSMTLPVLLISKISIHSAARAETGPAGTNVAWTTISIHSAARAETPHLVAMPPSAAYFNPLRREGGDLYGKSLDIILDRISIHSAARAETIEKQHAIIRELISIHSAARAETAIYRS